MSDSRWAIGGSRSAEDYRQRAEEQFKVNKKSNPKVVNLDGNARDAEAAKTTRLRDLRLAKEAADKDIAQREALEKANRFKPRSSTSAARVS
jgi:hypothetical protein